MRRRKENKKSILKGKSINCIKISDTFLLPSLQCLNVKEVCSVALSLSMYVKVINISWVCSAIMTCRVTRCSVALCHGNILIWKLNKNKENYYYYYCGNPTISVLRHEQIDIFSFLNIRVHSLPSQSQISSVSHDFNLNVNFYVAYTVLCSLHYTLELYSRWYIPNVGWIVVCKAFIVVITWNKYYSNWLGYY